MPAQRRERDWLIFLMQRHMLRHYTVRTDFTNIRTKEKARLTKIGIKRRRRLVPPCHTRMQQRIAAQRGDADQSLLVARKCHNEYPHKRETTISCSRVLTQIKYITKLQYKFLLILLCTGNALSLHYKKFNT